MLYLEPRAYGRLSLPPGRRFAGCRAGRTTGNRRLKNITTADSMPTLENTQVKRTTGEGKQIYPLQIVAIAVIAGGGTWMEMRACRTSNSSNT
jgi:hypothetical protein